MRRVMVVLLLAGSLAGCASNPVSESPWLVQKDASAPRSCEPLTADHELVLGLSQEMASAGRRHAALANLERLPSDVPQVRLSKARLLRVLGHGSEAETLYGSLLDSCLMADANHGLGQIEASRGRYPEAQGYLRNAASLSPANEAIRNDLGVVYMNQRRLSEARFELLTAMELEEHSRRAALNMLTLLVYQNNWQGARELVSARGLSSDDFKRAEQRAQRMRNKDAHAPTPAAVAQRVATPEPAETAAVPSLETPAVPAPRVQSVATMRAAAPLTARVPDAASLHVRSATASAPAPAPVHVSEALAAPTRTGAPMPVAVATRVWAAEEAAQGIGAANPNREAQRTPSADVGPIICRPSGSSVSPRSVMECLPNEG